MQPDTEEEKTHQDFDSDDSSNSNISNPAIDTDSVAQTTVNESIITLIYGVIGFLLLMGTVYAIVSSGVFSEFDLLREIIQSLQESI